MDHANSSGFPTSYEEFCYLITKRCGTALTRTYCAERVAALQDDNNPTTKEFANMYGEKHRNQIIDWYEQAGDTASD